MVISYVKMYSIYHNMFLKIEKQNFLIKYNIKQMH